MDRTVIFYVVYSFIAFTFSIHFFKHIYHDIPMAGHEIRLPLIGRQERVIFKAMFHVMSRLINLSSHEHINVKLIVP